MLNEKSHPWHTIPSKALSCQSSVSVLSKRSGISLERGVARRTRRGTEDTEVFKVGFKCVLSRSYATANRLAPLTLKSRSGVIRHTPKTSVSSGRLPSPAIFRLRRHGQTPKRRHASHHPVNGIGRFVA